MGGGIRGVKTMTLFGEEEQLEEKDDSRGRSAELIAQRDEHLLYRYVWYARDKRNAYAWIVDQLGKEFYLTPSTVGQKIANNSGFLYRIKKENLTNSQLYKKFPPAKW